MCREFPTFKMCDEFFWVKEKKQEKEKRKAREQQGKKNVVIKERTPEEQRVKSSTHFFPSLYVGAKGMVDTLLQQQLILKISVGKGRLPPLRK